MYIINYVIISIISVAFILVVTKVTDKALGLPGLFGLAAITSITTATFASYDGVPVTATLMTAASMFMIFWINIVSAYTNIKYGKEEAMKGLHITVLANTLWIIIALLVNFVAIPSVEGIPKLSYLIVSGGIVTTIVGLIALRIEQHYEIWVLDKLIKKGWHPTLATIFSSFTSLLFDSVMFFGALQLFYWVITTTGIMDSTPYGYIPVIFTIPWLFLKMGLGVINIGVFSVVLPKLIDKKNEE